MLEASFKNGNENNSNNNKTDHVHRAQHCCAVNDVATHRHAGLGRAGLDARGHVARISVALVDTQLRLNNRMMYLMCARGMAALSNPCRSPATRWCARLSSQGRRSLFVVVLGACVEPHPHRVDTATLGAAATTASEPRLSEFINNSDRIARHVIGGGSVFSNNDNYAPIIHWNGRCGVRCAVRARGIAKLIQIMNINDEYMRATCTSRCVAIAQWPSRHDAYVPSCPQPARSGAGRHSIEWRACVRRVRSCSRENAHRTTLGTGFTRCA